MKQNQSLRIVGIDDSEVRMIAAGIEAGFESCVLYRPKGERHAIVVALSHTMATAELMSNAMQLAAEGASLAGDFGHVSSESIVAMFKAAAAVRGEGQP